MQGRLNVRMALDTRDAVTLRVSMAETALALVRWPHRALVCS